MPSINLKAGATRGKYGHVIVRNADGSINREYKITGAEYSALALPGAGGPPGCTKAEWESGLAVAYGKDFDVGDISETDGTIVIKTAERIVGGRIIESFLRLEKGEWSGEIPNISVDPLVLAGVKVRVDPEAVDKIAERAKVAGIAQIINGVLMVS